jgi:hypothetical protein
VWNTLLLCFKYIQLSKGRDKFRWNLQSNGKFTVSLLYNAIVQPEISVDKNKKIWKMKIPLKIKIFLLVFTSSCNPNQR